MKIGILGSGMIGGTLARLLAHSNHDVKIGGRDPKKLEKLANEIGTEVELGTLREAVTFGDMAILALPWQSAVLEGALPSESLFGGKIVVDAMNPYRMSGGGIHQTGDLASSEHVASLLPKASLVKAFNTIFWAHLRDQGQPKAPLEQRRAIFIAGDIDYAKERVSQLIDDLGFAPVDTGSLHGSTIQEPTSALYNKDLKYSEAISLLRSVREMHASS